MEQEDEQWLLSVTEFRHAGTIWARVAPVVPAGREAAIRIELPAGSQMVPLKRARHFAEAILAAVKEAEEAE